METDEIMEEDFEEASDEAETEYQYFNDPSSTQPSSGPPSTPNSCASSPPVNSEEPISPQRNTYTPSILTQSVNQFVSNGGKPYAPRRGPGRPRKECIPGIRSIKDGRIFVKKYRGGITKLTSRKRISGKDERAVLQHFAHDRGLYLSLTGSPTDMITNNMDSSISDTGERNLQLSDDLPYFPEKWPGKVCALCNLGERSQLGQGEMLRLQISETEQQFYSDFTGDDKESSISDVSSSSITFPQFSSNRRQKGWSKCRNPVNTSEYVDELEKIGYFEPIEFSNIQDGNYYYVHRLCATWSFGVLREPSGALDKISSVISQSLRRKCSFCNHFGASVACKMSCPKFFHFACLPASGGFQIIQNYVSFCKEHLNQVPLICTDDINCRSCSALGDVSNLVMCSICGDHYHGTCIGLPQMPGVRAGWQCKSCQRCQICRVPDVNEGRALSCEQCHKIYHAHCMRPIISSIPKYGWKCRRCRVCSDCGSRTPGAGASSRWHAHYTVCDSCYQQRNKGFSCPICHRAYRAAAYREMVKCSWCNKVVHSTCDPEADLAVYHSKKENNPDYDYVCPPCKTLIQSGRLPHSLVRRTSHIDDEGSSMMSQDVHPEQSEGEILEKSSDFGLGKGKPFLGLKIGKKIVGLPFGQMTRNKGKLTFQRRARMPELGRKRGPKNKMRGIFGVPGLGLQRPTPDSTNTRNEDEPGVENRLVLCSAKDKFILTQDICVMCGAVGTDQEGCLIACTQCGQCYHPYCVNVKVTKIILRKGWRCLDCTVCEGCGEKNDEARLILCDECDISFHIYCMDPPLDFVPQGNWKCKWCAVCQKCGSNNAGKNSTWKNSYSECGPCASQVSCSACLEAYIDGELIIQCTNCERWLHGKCDSIKTEEEAEKCDDYGYVCILCRPKDVPPPHLVPQKKVPQITYSANNNANNVVEEPIDVSVSQSLEGSHYIDGVCLSEHGLNLIKSLQMEYVRKKRKKITSDLVNNKDAAILAAIESVVAGSGIDQIDDIKVEPLDPKEEAEIYKDGMVWERSDASPPEGFTLGTNEQGVVVLRKKRQRNLQKLGIGGFNVRNRTMKKDWFMKDDEEHGEHVVPPPNDNEKRKKPLRKKPKNKLTETYPAYLQEAFFGKSLLDTQKSLLESDSSDDETKSSVSDDKIIKLSPEELKILDEMKTEQRTSYEIPKENKDLTYPKLTCDIKNNTEPVEMIKDIISSDLLEPELVDSIMKEESGLNENSNSLDVAREVESLTNKKDSLNDILPSNFNLDSIEINSKDVEEIFQGVMETDTKPTILKTEQTTQDPACVNTSKEPDIRYITQGARVVARFLPTPQDFSANNDKVMETPQNVACNINQNFIGINDKTTSSNVSSNNFQSNVVQNPWSSISTSPAQPNEIQGSSTEDVFVPTPSAQANCSQKSSERMRRDEDLGEMATISAVLYANTNHPELKHDYPNWTDRCKQIYKRWRALSNEKKAPFLQQARDNRSALRMKKVQQAVEHKDKDSINLLLENNGESNEEDSSSSLCVESIEEGKDANKEIKTTTNVQKNPETRNRTINVNTSNIISLNYNINYLKEKFNLENKVSDFKESSYHKFFIRGNMQGPAPNVTVNANGVFNTNPKKVAQIYNPKLIRSTFPENKNIQNISVDFPFTNNTTNTTKEEHIMKPCFEAIRIKLDPGNKNMSTVLHEIETKTNLDQNIRVLTPSEIMKTLPVMPGQETTSVTECNNSVPCDLSAPASNTVIQLYRDYKSVETSEHLNERVTLPWNDAYLMTNADTQDQEKITTQQKALKEQEQERQWKQLQAMRAKEQQLQQFAAQGSQGNPNSIIGDKDIQTEKCSAFSPVPSTSHSPFNTESGQNTTYASQVTTYQNSPLPNTCSTAVNTNPNIIKQQENKQLRDLLQRQESTDVSRRNNNNSSNNKQSVAPENWNVNESNIINQSNVLNTSTFREPFPVSPLNKNNKPPNNTCGPRAVVQLTNKNVNRQISANKASFDKRRIKEHMSTVSSEEINKTELKKLVQNKFKTKEDLKSADNTDIAEGNTELDKLEQEENVGITEVEGVGDILGGLGEDDDDELLNSLTAEMGVDFNILEYADPELDALTDCNNQNLLDKLDFDEGVPEERSKKMTFESGHHFKSEAPSLKELSAGHTISSNNSPADFQMKHKKPEDRLRKELPIGKQSEPKNFTLTPPTVPGNRLSNVEAMNVLKAGDLSKAGNFPRYNLISQSTLCKISRGNLPPPPPPYPGPPPPYPSTIKNTRQDQQPLLLEDLLEQEKREQQQQLTSLIDNKPPPGNTFIKTDNLSQGGSVIVSSNWRKTANEINQSPMTTELPPKIRKQSINTNIINVQPPPPLPPENITNEHDRTMQLNYEQWLNNTNVVINNQLKIYEDEVMKLRKIRKSLNSKQRSMKRAGNELSPQDIMEFTKITTEQGIMQKHLENLRKQCRQHALLVQDYKSKHMAKLQMAANISSPIQINSGSPMVSPSNNSPSTLLMQTSPSPLGPHILQPTRSPLHSPSPLLSHSPVGVAQSPVNQSNVSPYQNTQSSPRIGTPLSQIDENSFSPSANMSSPSSMSGHHASSPRITSPQQRGNNPQLSVRMSTSPAHSFGAINNPQAQKFSNTHPDRGRTQLPGQQCLSQNVGAIEIQAPLASPIPMSAFGQSADSLHASRSVMHFFHQKHGIQRQQSNPNISKSKAHPSMSPKTNSTPPPSPHLHYSIQQHINRKTTNEISSDSYSSQGDPHEQFAQHCRDNTISNSPSDLSTYLKSNQDNNAGGGGGLSNLGGNYLPGNGSDNSTGSGGGLLSLGGNFLPGSGSVTKFGRFGRIKLGLFGGSPMWSLSNLKCRGNGDSQPKHGEIENNLNRSRLSNEDSTTPSTSAKTQCSNKLISQSSKSQGAQPSNETMKTSKICEGNIVKPDMNVNSIVVIDDSPSEKQRIMEYDDYQDKGIVTTEVSLNSAAQNITDSDEMAVMESFASSQLADIVSSPLESEAAEEYVLFSSDVVDYADSDDSLKTAPIPQKHEDVNMKEDNNMDNSLAQSMAPRNTEQRLEENLAVNLKKEMVQAQVTKFKEKNKSPELKNFATAEDFEAMIDCRPPPRKDDDKRKPDEVIKLSTADISRSISTTCVGTNVLTCSRIPFTAVTCGVITGMSTQTTTSQSVVMASKKMVTDVTQATAKVSIGNTTISVPLLKTMTLSSSHIIPPEKRSKDSSNVNITKQPTILNVRGQKLNAGTIVSLSSLQIKPATNSKIVQATVVGKKLQLPQATLDNVSNVKHNLNYSFNYPKLSSLTVLQDMPLPNKIFEDECASPENSQEHNDTEATTDAEGITSHSHQGSKIEEIQKINNNEHFPEKSCSPKIHVEEKKMDDTKSIENEVTKFQSRQLSAMPQLSPLPKPTEMTTNMANASQQLRNIMASINSSVQRESKSIDHLSGIENLTSNTNSGKFENKKDSEMEKSSSGFQTNSSVTEDKNSISLYITNSALSPKKQENYNDLKKDNATSEKSHSSTTASTYSKMLPSATIITSISNESNKASVTPSYEGNKKVSVALSSHLKRSKSTDDGIEREVPAQISGAKRYSLEMSGKTESSENSVSSKSPPTVIIKSKDQSSSSICKTSAVTAPHLKSEESQNVLLKQLLQNSSGSNTSSVSQQIMTGRKVPALRAPSLGVVSSLEAQLARPVIPPVPTNQPSMLQSSQHQMAPHPENTIKESNDEVKKTNQIISRETSFVSNPLHKSLQTVNERVEKSASIQSSTDLTLHGPEKVVEENKLQIENSSTNNTPLYQKEIEDLTQKTTYIDDVKSMNDFSASPKRPNSRTQIANNEPVEESESNKEEKARALDAEINNEFKKRKKREYQKNRRQMLNKDIVYSKKRSRKLSKLDEDYDNFIDNLMVQLRQMPSLQVLEPLLSRNYSVCPPYGAGDSSKMTYAKEHPYTGNLYGTYGNAFSANITDFYNIKPFGYLDGSVEDSPTTIQNGFYDQEFPPIKFDNDVDHIYKLESMFKDRDIDTPESIVTSSSPECVVWDAALAFPGLKLIKEDDDSSCYDRMSPIVPVIAPIPIKLQSGIDLSLDKNQIECCKENALFGDWRRKPSQQANPTKDSNVTVTLTLTSSAAEDIMGVLRDLANILRIPPPTSYQIVERTTTPPSQKLGLYRTRGKDGKEGNPIDIQTILNGTAKFCRHCDVVILNTIIRAKASEFPLLTSSELINNNDDLYFCSKTCYKQFKWRPTNIIEDNMLSSSKSSALLKDTANKLEKEIKSEYSGKGSSKGKNFVDDFSDRVDEKTFSSTQIVKTNQYIKTEFSGKFNESNSRNARYRYFSQSSFHSPTKFKRSSEKEVTEMLFKMSITVTPTNKTPDTRQCIFCGQIGDGVADGPSRLLNFDVDKWVHLNCALWSDGVYETVNGGLMNLESALQASLYQSCTICHHLGATIKCFKNRCSNIYHLSCAIKDHCIFYKNKTTHCQCHALKNEKENELTTLSVQRRVYVERDESRQVAAVMHHSELNNLLRVGSLTFLNIGQLLPHQLQAFHTPNYIYPIGYKIIRFYWSMRRPNKRCRYICSIADVVGRPEFRILVQEPSEDDIELRDSSPRAVWQRILEPIAMLRKNCDLVQLFPKYITGEDLFGLTEPAVVRILESLPGIETLTDYRFKYGRNPLLELPLAINPSGAARTEPKQKQAVGWRKPHTQRSGSTNQRLPLTPTTSVAGEVACPYSKQFVHSKSSQYKKMKQEWRNNVFLARSKIQGLGLYAARDLEKHTMVIEYIGEVIRTEVSEIREKQYEARNRGIYMFRLDEDRVVDATLSGGLARYINHSCNPNCVTEIVEVDREYRIIIFAKRRINRGEELSYDYKFDIEDDAHKISCMCGAPNCRKWMN